MTPRAEDDDIDFVHTAWSWVEHLRNGGTTPWARWTAPASSAACPTGRLPGAAQLEDVRRLAGRRGAGGGDFTELADLVLARSGPGRGPGEIPLARQGSAPSPRTLGPPAIDPSDVPVEELVRVCVGVLCDLVTERPPLEPRNRPRRRPWTKGFHLAGPPVSAASLRASLASAGHVEGGRKPQVIIVSGTLDDMLREAWTARVQNGTNVRWSRFVGKLVEAERLPGPADLPAVAARWAARVGAGRVHVVAAHDNEEVRRTVGKILGVAAPPDTDPEAADLLPLPPPGVDVLRRLGAVLNVRVGQDRRRPVLRQAARHLLGGGAPLVVPDRYGDWARERSERMAEELWAGGYAVHGDLQRIVSRRTSESRDSVDKVEVLDLALSACLRAAER